MNDLSETVDQLSLRLEVLEHRVSELERPALTLPDPAAALSALPVAEPHLALAPAQPGQVSSLLGQCMLGIAGAYLLRALAESNALPRAPVVALAIAYALFWLIPARGAKSWLPAVAWAGTSALILLPMLWELTVRFSFLPVAASAGVLCTFVLVASALAWSYRFTEIASVVETAAAAGAVALALATRNLIPFLGALLLIALMGEIAAARGRRLHVRALVAAAADVLMFGILWIRAGSAASGQDHTAAGSALALSAGMLALYAAGATTQTLILRRRISFFETAQSLLAFLLAFWGVLSLRPESGARGLAILCLVAAAGGYGLAFGRFRSPAAARNYHVYATGSLALVLAGCSLSLSGDWLPLSFSLLAVAGTLLGRRLAVRTLEFHGLAWLFAAAASSGLLAWIGHALADGLPAAPRWIICLAAAAAMASYSAIAPGRERERWPHGLRLLEAALAAGALAALVVFALARATALVTPAGTGHLAVLRTLTGCGLAAALAWLGARRRRREMVWLAWTGLLLLAAKLLFEDLRHGHLGYTAASIFVYAVTLLMVPRMLRTQSGSPRFDSR
ncbi:MAG TPA: hypothetical protein VIY53_04780 [Acidobacteriaceae bacterium]